MNIITVIGNGFDLQLGLKTRYTDFFKWLFEDKDKSTEENYVEIKPINNNVCPPCFYDFPCDISRITDWWSLYFLENKNKLPDSNWCSVEEEIEKVFKYNKYSENGITELDSMCDWRKYPPRDGVDFYGAIRMKNELYPKNDEDIFNYLLNELKKFERKFIEYLFKAMPDDYSERAKTLKAALKRSIAQDKLYNNLQKHIIKGEKLQNQRFDTHLLNFNYLTIEWGVNLHGSISDNNIIFGIDETADVAKNSRIFKKTYRKLFLRRTQRDLPETCDYLTFFGHSLAHADYSYFQSLFDLYNIYGGKTKLVFFVNNQPRPDNPDLPKENVLEKTDAIYKLMHYYGEKTHGIEKGGNLLHKLLLENRVQIVEAEYIAEFPSFDPVEIKKDEEKNLVESC
jgi:hypothetical protein